MKHVCQYCEHCIFVEEWEEGYGFTDYNHCEIATERNKRIDEIPKKELHILRECDDYVLAPWCDEEFIASVEERCRDRGLK